MKEQVMNQSLNTEDQKVTIIAKKQARAERAEKKRLSILKRAEKEADKRRKVNSQWKRISLSNRYRKAASKLVARSLAAKVEENLMDGIFLKLNDRNMEKTSRVQRRILRRIVDKRQAQAIHKVVGRTTDLFAAHLGIECQSRCMMTLHNRQRRVG